MPTYNNPDFYWNFTETSFEWNMKQEPSDIFLESSSEGYNFIITTFAEQGFLIKGRYRGNWSCLDPYTPSAAEKRTLNTIVSHFARPTDNRFTFILNLLTGVITSNQISYVFNQHNYSFYLTITDICILSYRKRYLRFQKDNVNYTIINISSWTSTTFKNINFFEYKEDDEEIKLYFTEIYSIVPEEWVYYNNYNLISSIDDFPVYKYVYNNEIFYNIVDSIPIRWPEDSTNRAILKATGKHFLFNNVNLLQQRDFSTFSNEPDIITTSDSQNYNKIVHMNQSTNNGAYKINGENNWILNKYSEYNKKVESKGPPYKYFHSNQPIYTDLLDNNTNLPTLKEPILLYNNISTLTDKGINLTAKTFPANIFWIDTFTLFCIDKIYYVPKEWTVSVLRTSPGGITIRSHPRWEVWSPTRAVSIVQQYGYQTTIRTTNSKNSFSLLSNNRLEEDLDIDNFAWQQTSGSYLIHEYFKINNSNEVKKDYEAGLKYVQAKIVNNGTHFKVEYTAYHPIGTVLDWEKNVTNTVNINHDFDNGPLKYSSSYADYIYISNATFWDSIDLTAYLSISIRLNQYNGLFNLPNALPLLEDSRQEIAIGNHLYYYQRRADSLDDRFGTTWWAHAFGDCNLVSTGGNPNGYYVIIYNKEYSHMTCSLSYSGYESYSYPQMLNVRFYWNETINPPLSITIGSETFTTIDDYILVPSWQIGNNTVTVNWTENLSENYTISITPTTPIDTEYQWEYYK